MADEKTVISAEVMAPVPITVVGTGDGLIKGTKAVTPPDQPNVVIQVVPQIVALLVRFGNEFCVSFAGSLVAGGITAKVIPHADLVQLVETAALLAAIIAGVGLVKNAGTIFGKLEGKYPLLTGSI